MLQLPTNLTDPVFTCPARYRSIDKFFIKLIRDERDLPFIYFVLKIGLFIVPVAVLLFTNVLSGWIWLATAIVYMLVTSLLFIGKFALMFHCTAHRPLFKKQYNYLNYFLPYLVAPLFGHMAETYYAHHVGMHHAENNLEDDESSTMAYQRDSFRHFLLYLARFVASGIFDLARYFHTRKRKKLMYKAIQGQILMIILIAALCFFNWKATLCVFVFPYFLYRIIAMLGNWAQHAFIDPADPGNAYKNSITCINSKYNWQCWNDGYHITHHIKQTLHWTEHPLMFQNTIADYTENNAVVFSKIDFMLVSVFLLCKRYDLLAKNFVNIGGRFQSDAEVIVFLKERAQRI
jgi:fatty acid desaturase